MSLLFFDSFDHYQTADIVAKYDGSDSSVSIVDGGRCGTRCLRSQGFPGSTGVVKGVSAVGDTCIVGMAIKRVTGGNPGGLFTIHVAHIPIISFYLANDGSVFAYYNPDAAFPPFSFASYGGILPSDEYHYLEVKTVLGNPGSVAIQVDGVPVFDTTCITSVDGSAWTGVALVSGGFGSGNLRFVDDLYISDADGAAPWNDVLGDVRVERLRPLNNGAVQMWALGAGAAHWEAVDDADTPDGDASYITTTTFGDIETNIHEPSALPPGGRIYGVQMSFYAKKDQPGDRQIAPVFRQAGSNYLGPGVGVTQGAYSFSTAMSQASPATSTEWTLTEINTQEYGVEVTV